MTHEHKVQEHSELEKNHNYVVSFYDPELNIFLPVLINPRSTSDNLSMLVTAARSKAVNRLRVTREIVLRKRGTRRGSRETRDIEASKDRTKKIAELNEQVRDLSGKGTRGIQLSDDKSGTLARIVVVDIPREQEDWVQFTRLQPELYYSIWQENRADLKTVHEYFKLRMDVKEGRKQLQEVQDYNERILSSYSDDSSVIRAVAQVVNYFKS